MRSKRDVAIDLANAHRSADPATKLIKYFPDAEADHVCLLEVSDTAPTTNEVLKIAFAAQPKTGIDYRSQIILLSPDDWSAVIANNLCLPNNWDITGSEEL